MKEADLIKIVRDYYDIVGCTTYGEVSIRGGGAIRCDLFVINKQKLTIALEAKTSFSFKVLEQAYLWKKHAHYTYIVVPANYKTRKNKAFKIDLCVKLGLGLIEVNMTSKKINVIVQPELNNKPKIPNLYDEQKDTIASNDQNLYVTPFKITVTNINKYMENQDKIILRTLIMNISHHYKNDMSACNAIKKLVENKVIKGFYINKEKGKLIISKKDGF